MRKVLFILIAALLFLVGCSDSDELAVHENIDDDLAKDSIQVMNILADALDDDILVDDLPQDNVGVLNSYGDKYNEKDRDSLLVFNGTEEEIITFALGTITRYSMYTGLESDKEQILEGKESIEEMIKTGKDYLEINS